MKKIFLASLFIFFFILNINISAKTYSYGLGRTKDHSRPTPGSELVNLIKTNNSIYIGNDEKEVYLTFDCGFEDGYTAAILDALKETDTKAIFFITGHYLTSATNLVKRMIEEGHVIGNHSYYHKDYSKITQEEMIKDLTKLEQEFTSLTGTTMSHYFRPPEGKISTSSLEFLSSKGYKTIFWSLAYVDWHKDKSFGKEYSYNNVMERMHNGAIILMHTVGKDNSLALKDIIIDLKNDGYIFKEIKDLI